MTLYFFPHIIVIKFNNSKSCRRRPWQGKNTFDIMACSENHCLPGIILTKYLRKCINFLYFYQRASVDNLYAAFSNNEPNFNISKSGPTSPTRGSAYKRKDLGAALTKPDTNTKDVSGSVGTKNSSSTNSTPRRGTSKSRTSNDAWVCPSDRQLALRAK